MNAPVQHTETIPVIYQYTIEELRTQLQPYADSQFTTPKLYAEGKKALAVCRALRGEIEAKRKELKSDALEYGRKVDAAAKELTAIVAEVEDPLKDRKAAVDEEKAREKREREEAERLAREAELQRIRDEQEALASAQREAEERRLAEERARLEAERQQLEAERRKDEAAKLERERVAREKREAEERKLAAEREKLEAERRAIEEKRIAAERDEAARQARIQAEKEAAERAERERIEAEERAVREAERQAERARRLEALKPDKDKSTGYLDKMLTLSVPDVSDQRIADLLSAIRSDIRSTQEAIEGLD